jgi:hypothetical protein
MRLKTYGKRRCPTSACLHLTCIISVDIASSSSLVQIYDQIRERPHGHQTRCSVPRTKTSRTHAASKRQAVSCTRADASRRVLFQCRRLASPLRCARGTAACFRRRSSFSSQTTPTSRYPMTLLPARHCLRFLRYCYCYCLCSCLLQENSIAAA